jgi:hypothetical protein
LFERVNAVVEIHMPQRFTIGSDSHYLRSLPFLLSNSNRINRLIDYSNTRLTSVRMPD